MSPNPSTLLDLFAKARPDSVAIAIPEKELRITYAQLRDQVQAVAEALAAAGITKGDRVGTALTNGLPNIVTFLAASMVGTAAPLNPSYKEDDFRFYLDGRLVPKKWGRESFLEDTPNLTTAVSSKNDSRPHL